MIKSFNKNGKYYYCKIYQNSWSYWVCRHEDGLETRALVNVASYKLKRQDVINAIDNVDNRFLNETI